MAIAVQLTIKDTLANNINNVTRHKLSFIRHKLSLRAQILFLFSKFDMVCQGVSNREQFTISISNSTAISDCVAITTAHTYFFKLMRPLKINREHKNTLYYHSLSSDNSYSQLHVNAL